MASTATHREVSAFTRVMNIMARRPIDAPKRSHPMKARSAKPTKNGVEQLWAAAAAPTGAWADILSPRSR